jgi:hypothetical protein
MNDGLAILESSDYLVLDNIPIHLDHNRVMKRLYFHRDIAVDEAEVQDLIENVEFLSKPCAIYKSSRVSEKTRDSLKIEETEFRNSLLNINLGSVDRVFPYVVTCGNKIDSRLIPRSDCGLSYCLAVIKEMILDETSNYLQTIITHRFSLDYLWQLKPGYLQAWPKNDRRTLFSILGNVEKAIGVSLTYDYSLKPAVSDCGLFYYADMKFEACQICPQDPCMGRRAPYCEQLAVKFSDKAQKPCGIRK